jgi:8-oxo-dGTP pyrophosphatase MutT (NUDIX family)
MSNRYRSSGRSSTRSGGPDAPLSASEEYVVVDDGEAVSDADRAVGKSPVYTVRNAAKALITNAGRALLTEETHADGSSFWTLPGGGLEAHETHVDCLRRELFEELRCHVRVGSHVDTVLYHHRSSENTISRYAVFECELRSSFEPNPREEIRNAAWVAPESLPAKTLPQFQQVLSGATSL